MMSLSHDEKWTYTKVMQLSKNPISVGCKVEVNLIDRGGNKNRLSFIIVPDESADFEHSFLGMSTPIARALLGERQGNTIPYLRDDILAIEILSVTQSTEKPPDDVKKKRQTRMNKAIREVEHTNAVVFASSFSGKWGDYDPNSLPKDEASEENQENE